jgi:predicted metal-dependent hydrolase
MPIRMLPKRAFPPYSYVPGKFPHPTSDERGHSFGHVEPPCAAPAEEKWKVAGRGEGFDPYVWGFELFNHGYYWEAHEVWEAVWHACERTGTKADLIKGLIKLAAAGVKAREGSREGVRRHLLRGADLFEHVDQAIGPEKRLLGIEPRDLAVKVRDLAAKSEELVNTSHEPVVVVMPMEIYPLRGTE